MYRVNLDQVVMDQVIQRLIAAADPEKIILFGSRARGSARPDSDLDLLLIAKGPGPSRELEVRAYASLRGRAVPVDILCYTPEQVEQWSAAPNHVIARAVREGQLLYEKRH